MDAVEKAIGSLLTLATPQSQLKLAYRGAGAPDRYLLAALSDGRWLAIDRNDRNKAYLLTKQLLAGRPNGPLVVELQEGGVAMVEGYTANKLDVRPAPDGDYPLPQSGRIVVKQGLVAAILGTPKVVLVALVP